MVHFQPKNKLNNILLLFSSNLGVMNKLTSLCLKNHEHIGFS